MNEKMRKALGFLGLVEDDYNEYAATEAPRPFSEDVREEQSWASRGAPARPAAPAPRSARSQRAPTFARDDRDDFDECGGSPLGVGRTAGLTASSIPARPGSCNARATSRPP